MRGGTMLCSTAWLLLLLLLHARGTRAHGGHVENDFSEDRFVSWWLIYEVDEVMYADFWIKAELTETNAWVAIGFKTKESLGSTANFDVVLAYNGSVTDRWAKGVDQFSLDTALGGTDDVTKTGALYHDGFIEANFTRKLNTGDKNFDFDLEGPMPFALFWAYGLRNGDVFTSKSYGDAEKDFYPSELDNVANKMKTHGILMVFVLMILMTSGIVLSRYMKTVFYWWFYVHAAVFVFSLVFMTISCVLIFQAHNNTFYAGWHSMFGLFFIIAMGSQSLLGLLSHLQFDKKRLAPPVFPDKAHWWLGRATFFIGIIAILLGLDALPARRLAWNSFWIFLIGIFFLVLTLEKYVGQTHEVVAKGIAEDDEAFDTRDDDDLMYVPKKGNSLSVKQPTKQLSMRGLLKILVPAGFGIGLLFILVAVGISTTIE